MKLPDVARLVGEVRLEAPVAGQPRRFAQLAHAGSRISGFFYDTVFALSGMGCPKKIPILHQHDMKAVLALSEDAKVDGDGLHVTGQLYKTRLADEVADLGDQGFPWQASIGVRALEAEFVEDGEEREVNGRLEKGPFVCVTKSSVFESSFCALGADTNTRSVVLSGDAQAGFVEVRTKEKDMADVKTDATVDVLGAERKRVHDLQLAFPKDPTFAFKHITAGSSLLEAKADFADELQKRLEQRQLAGDKLPATGGGIAPEVKLSAIDRWNEAMTKALGGNLAPTKKERWEATRRLAIAQKELHKEYLEEYNLRHPGRPAQRGA